MDADAKDAGGILKGALVVMALGAWSATLAQLQTTSDLGLNVTTIGLDEEMAAAGRHVLSAWGAAVFRRPGSDNYTHDVGHVVALGGLPLPRSGHLVGWRAFFSRTDVPVDLQLWRPEGGGGRMRLIGRTGPLVAERTGLRVITLESLGMEPLPFEHDDLLGLGLESVSPVSLTLRPVPVPDGCLVYEAKTEGFLLTCTSHQFRKRAYTCPEYSLQALLRWTPQGGTDVCARRRPPPELPPSTSGGGGGGRVLPGVEDYEMPVYTMPCREVVLGLRGAHGTVGLSNFTDVPPAEDICLLIILNLGDSEMTSQYALRADLLEMELKETQSAGECSPFDPRVEFQNGPFMASRVVRSFCRFDPGDHLITVCERHLRIRMSNRAKMAALNINYRVVHKAVTSCRTTSPWFPRAGSRVSAIVAIVVISFLAVGIAIGVTRLARRGAPLFRERATSPQGSELFGGPDDDVPYRCSLSMSSTTTSWTGEHAQHGRLLSTDGRTSGSDVTSASTVTERVIDVSVNEDDDEAFSPLSLTSPTSFMTQSSLTSAAEASPPISGSRQLREGGGGGLRRDLGSRGYHSSETIT